MSSSSKNELEKLHKLEEKKKLLDARILSMKSRLKKKERSLDTRKKILIGAYFLDKYKKDMDRLIKEMDSFLVRDIDRKLFDLETLKK